MEIFMIGMVTGMGIYWLIDYTIDWIEENIFWDNNE